MFIEHDSFNYSYHSLFGYYDNGSKSYEHTLLKGQLLSTKLYNTNGKMIHELKLSDGHIISGENFTPDGLIHTTLTPDSTYQSFNAKEYNTKGNMLFSGKYLNGQREGHGVAYTPNGIPTLEGNWKGPTLHGKGIKFYPSGAIEYQGNFVAGRKEGFGVCNFEDSTKKFSFFFFEGK
jgi:antitoxin component YwqK of YwqJK toxin-antitoxin module